MEKKFRVRDFKHLANERLTKQFSNGLEAKEFLNKPLIAFGQIGEKCIFGPVNNIALLSSLPIEVANHIYNYFIDDKTIRFFKEEQDCVVILGEDSLKAIKKCITYDTFLNKIQKLSSECDDLPLIYFKTDIEHAIPILSYGLCIADRNNIDDFLNFPSYWNPDLVKEYKNLFVNSGLMIGGDLQEYFPEELE